MRILQKLLDNLGSLWNTLPKEVPLFTIAKGTGQHTSVTVDGGMLYFHSQPYHKDIPQRQEVALDGLTASEFIDVVQGMGYVITYTSEALSHGLNVHKPFILLEAADVPLTATLTAYTSNLWKIMYPVYRVLREAEFDTSEAIKAWYRPLADGEWLDFWADFFNIKREPGEDDNNFSRRFTMWLFNPKTNNVALEELLSYRLQDRNIEVRDRGALQFELIVGTKYIADASDLHKILRETKGAGIEYFLNYQADLMEEQYPIHWADKHGKPFTQVDGGKPQAIGVTKAATDVYVKPTEVPLRNLIKTLQDAYATPVEAYGVAMLRSFTEQVERATEARTSALQRVDGEWARRRYAAFNGTSSYIEASGGAFGGEYSTTVECWIYPTGNGAVVQCGGTTNYAYLFQIESANTARIRLWDMGNAGVNFSVSGDFRNKWTHIAFSYDGEHLRAYVDGKLSKVYEYSGRLGTSRPLRFGEYGGGGTRWFSGFISDVRIWSIVRTQGEIQRDMYQQLNGDEPGLVGYWKLDEGTGAIATDSTANGNDGSVVGAAWGDSWQEATLTTVSKPSEDLYELPPASNIGVSMTLNESELWDAETELLDTSSLHQDTALITVTVGGDVVDSVLV